jgi:type I restriction enzyme, R subunit
MDKSALTERDICTKFILPAVKRAGWDEMVQVREEVYFTKGRIIARGKLVTRGKAKKADFLLYYKPNIPIALIEAKDNNHSVGDGMQQGLDYGATLDIPFVFSSNGDGFVFHDRTGNSVPIEANLGLDAFPSPADLWARYRAMPQSRPSPRAASGFCSSWRPALAKPIPPFRSSGGCGRRPEFWGEVQPRRH